MVATVHADSRSVRPGYRAPPRPSYRPCPKGLVRKADGNCVEPIVNKNIFLYNAPPIRVNFGPAPYIPDPEVDFNYVFIKSPSAVLAPEPLIVPPADQKTLVYVLSEQPKIQQQQVIQVPGVPTKPEVFFINYNDGENPTLPGGINLQTALSQSAQQGQLIEGEDSASGSGYSRTTGGSGSAQVLDANDISNSLFINSGTSYAAV